MHSSYFMYEMHFSVFSQTKVCVVSLTQRPHSSLTHWWTNVMNIFQIHLYTFRVYINISDFMDMLWPGTCEALNITMKASSLHHQIWLAERNTCSQTHKEGSFIQYKLYFQWHLIQIWYKLMLMRHQKGASVHREISKMVQTYLT